MTGLADPLSAFEHVVVLMLENRSFDNLLGYLYPSELRDGRRFEGLRDGKKIFNPIPPGAPQPEPPTDGDTKDAILAKSRFTDYSSPFPDPGEPYPHVNLQLFYPDQKEPGPPPAPLPHPGMKGFVADYIANYPKEHGKGPGGQPTYAQYRMIMDSYPRETVPVLSGLARGFAVFDHWHCSVPSQTWCNRAFWHAASSYGQVINGPSLRWFCRSTAANLFTRLVERFGDPSSRKHPGPETAWRIYSPAWNFVPLTLVLHLRRLFRYWDEEHIRDLEQFFRDCADGRLPRYTFLEPLFLCRHNDQHPSSLHGRIDGPVQPGSVLLGEHLIRRVYEAIRSSRSPAPGNNSQNTLLVITHDEHGGCYDHVPPGAGVPPSGRLKRGQMGFTFDRVGVRVPMVMVSAWIEPETIVSETFDHTSFLRTMEDKWGLTPLTERDRNARPFATEVFKAPAARPASEWPPLQVPELHHGWEKHEGFRAEGIHQMQRDLLHAAGAVYGVSRRRIERLETLGEAHDLFTEHLRSRGGRRRPLWRILASRLFG